MTDEGDNISSVSISSVSLRSTAPTQVHFSLVITIVADCAGLMLPPPVIPKLVNHQPGFVLPDLPDTYQCAEASWQCPLKSKVPVTGRVARRQRVLASPPPQNDNLYSHPATTGIGLVSSPKAASLPRSVREKRQDTFKYSSWPCI